MSQFRITYADGEPIEVSHVSRLTYVSNERKSIVIEDGLDDYPVPIGRSFWLKTDKGIVGINGEGIRSIVVTAD